jgi:Uma2 family endonuclease
MYTVISPDTLQLPPGALVRLPANWATYQKLQRQRGEASIPRLKFRPGEVLLMAPLAQHGRDASLIADIIKTLLDCQSQEYDAFTPITMDLPEVSGIEPDYCFYIQNWPAISGKKRIDWASDPPPDLVLEIDVTSYSNVADYLPYQVPEIWLYKNGGLEIYHLTQTEYCRASESRYIPNYPDLPQLVKRYLDLAYDRNTSTALRQLRHDLAQRS